MIKGAIFDVDGTILDSMPMWDDIGRIYLRQKGIRADPSLNRVMFSMTMAEGAAYLNKTYRLSATTEAVVQELNTLIFTYYEKKLLPKPGVSDFLRALNRRGIPMTVATISTRDMIDAAFSRLCIDRFFSRIFTAEEVGAGKDKPDIFYAAQTHMRTERSDTWVFEDGLYAAQTAKSAGFRVCGVFDQSSAADREKIEAICDVYVTSLSDFPF